MKIKKNSYVKEVHNIINSIDKEYKLYDNVHKSNKKLYKILQGDYTKVRKAMFDVDKNPNKYKNEYGKLSYSDIFGVDKNSIAKIINNFMRVYSNIHMSDEFRNTFNKGDSIDNTLIKLKKLEKDKKWNNVFDIDIKSTEKELEKDKSAFIKIDGLAPLDFYIVFMDGKIVSTRF